MSGDKLCPFLMANSGKKVDAACRKEECRWWVHSEWGWHCMMVASPLIIAEAVRKLAEKIRDVGDVIHDCVTRR